MTANKLRLLLIMIRRRILLIGSCTVLALALAVVYCAATPPIYQATASLLVQYNQDALNKNGRDQPSGQFDDLATQKNVIATPVVIDRALGSLAPFELGPALANLSTEDRRTALARNFSVTFVRGARLLHLAYLSPNRATTTAVVAAITDSYLKFIAETHRNSSQEVLEILTQQKTELEGQLLQNDEQMLKLQLAAGVILSDRTRTSSYEKRLAALEEELLKAQAVRIRAAGLYRQVCSGIDCGGSQDFFTLRLTGNLGQQVVSEKMGVRSDNLRFWQSTAEANLIKDEVDLNRLASVYGPEHPSYKALKARIEMNRAYLKNPNASSADTLDKRGRQVNDLVRKAAFQEMQEAQTIEQELSKKIATEKAETASQNAKYLHLRTLESKGERLKSFYDVVLKRIRELDIGENLAQIKVTVVGPPALTKKPVSPRIPTVLALALFAGLTAGFGTAVLLERLDNKFRSPEEIQQLLQAPIVGNVPTFKASLPCPAAMLMAQAPNAPEAEAFRSIRTWLMFRNDVRMFCVSSPLQGDGKSTIISNLAGALAQAGKRTLLMDADLRRPRLQSIWALAPARGLSYLLMTGRCTPQDVAGEIQRSPLDNLDLLPCGSIPANPGELLEKPDLLILLQWARTHYDYVLIDSPPLIPVADSRTIARLVDGLILVVRVQKDSRELAFRARNHVVEAGGTVLGVVANGSDHLAKYGYYHEGKYGYEEAAEEGEEPPTADEDAAAA